MQFDINLLAEIVGGVAAIERIVEVGFSRKNSTIRGLLRFLRIIALNNNNPLRNEKGS